MEESAPAPEAINVPVSPVESSSPPAPAPSSLLGGAPSEPVAAPVGDIPTNQTPIEQSVSTEPWHSKLDGRFKDNPNINKYNSLEDALDGQLSLVKMIGSKGLVMPDENATTEDWNAFYSKTGRPDSVDDYSDYQQNITVDDAGNEQGHFEFDKEGLAYAKEEFFKSGQSDKMAQANLKVFAKISSDAQARVEKQMAEEADHTNITLRKAFGGEFDAKMSSFNAVAKSLGIAEDIKAMGLGNNLNMIMALDKITNLIGESKLTGDVSPSGGGFEAQMAAIKNSPGYRVKEHPNYHNLQKQRNDLYLQRQKR